MTLKRKCILFSRYVFCCILFASILSSCTAGSSQPPAKVTHTSSPPSLTPTTAPVLIPRTCQPPTPIHTTPQDQGSMPELHGIGHNAELWVLLFEDPIVAKQEAKIVWRMTGTGDFHIVALSPHGTRLSPSSGPDLHTGSSWNRPGDEWGTLFTFPTPGCWNMHAIRSQASGDIWLMVQ